MNAIDNVEMIKKIKKLIETLNHASDAYYNSTPIMDDKEWDSLYCELQNLESESGVIYPDSPTQNVGYKIIDSIKKVKLDIPMLSLDKCHTKEELMEFANDKDCILSLKCDGLSTRLHYMNGKLVGANTRGNGTEGGDVLHNVKTIKNIPNTIPYQGELIIDGETIIDWNAFNEINNNLPEGQEKYKHPRNLVSGSLNLLDSKIASKRNMRFIAWRVIKPSYKSNTILESFIKIKKLGFEVVPCFSYCNRADRQYLGEMLEKLKEEAYRLGIPFDGIVMAYNNIEYGMSLGRTTKFFRHSIAYKFEDQEFKTVLKDIEWSMGKTGQLTPVAIFEPVEIDGTMVERASLHNVSVMYETMNGGAYVGETVYVAKKNQIIPQIVKSEITTPCNAKHIPIPENCPICGEKTQIVKENNSKILICTNENCKGKLLGKLVHAVSKNALNIDGLSEATIEKFISNGWLDGIYSIYNLKNYYSKLVIMPGFGMKSVNKLLQSIENSKHTALDRFIYAHSIPLIGHTASKIIAKDCNGDYNLFITKLEMFRDTAFTHIDGFGSEMGNKLYTWFMENGHTMCKNAKLFIFEQNNDVTQVSNKLDGKVFCITGSVNIYKNRDELKRALENVGAKVTASVTSKTNYLVNNDINSNSSKNKKAKELCIEIITEETVKNMIDK